MRLYRVAQQSYAEDLSGKSAELYEGSTPVLRTVEEKLWAAQVS